MSNILDSQFIPTVEGDLRTGNYRATYANQEDAEQATPPYWRQTVITAAFMDGEELDVKRVGCGILHRLHPSAEELNAMYARTIGERQAAMNELLEVVPFDANFADKAAVEKTCAEIVLKNGQRLLAAHIVGRVIATKADKDVFVYHKALIEEIPLIIRDKLVSHVHGSKLNSEQQANFRAIAQGGSGAEHVVAFAASLLMPTPKEFNQRVVQN